jgi:hypothetical protein
MSTTKYPVPLILLNHLEPNYIYDLLYQSVTLNFEFVGFHMFFTVNGIIFLNSVNQLIFVMVKCGVLFEVRTEFLNNI